MKRNKHGGDDESGGDPSPNEADIKVTRDLI
jgi:hypothetical protein